MEDMHNKDTNGKMLVPASSVPAKIEDKFYKDNTPSEEEEIHLRDYWEVILKHRWTVITIFLVTVVTVTIGSFSTKPIYKATTTVKIEKESPKVVTFDEILPMPTETQDFYQTQYGILKSRAIAQMVIERLSLDSHPEFENGSKGAMASTPEKEKAKLTDNFLGRLTIDPVRTSRLVKISFQSHNPALPAQVADAVVQAYMDFNIESKFKATEKAREWLAKKIDEIKAKVEVSEEALQAFAREQGIFSLEKDENIVMQKLEALHKSLSEAESDRITKEASFKESHNTPSEFLSMVRDNELIKGLKSEYARLEAEYSKLSELYKPDYPQMVRLNTQMASIEKRIKKEISNLVKGIASDYKEAVKREQLLRESFETQREMALQMKEKSVQYNILKREVDTNKELYDGFLQRAKEVGASGGLDAVSNVQVVDRAEVPSVPFKPNKRLNILLGAVTGLFAGIGFAFFLEYMDNAIKDPEDVERFLFLPTLGLIPTLEIIKGKDSPSPPFISFLDTKSPLTEAFRTLRTSILFSSPGSHPKTILITSSRAGEGKTTVTTNLATVLTQGGAKVLIIDTDLRKPSIHKVFSTLSSPGLTNLLTGTTESDTVRQRVGLAKERLTNLLTDANKSDIYNVISPYITITNESDSVIRKTEIPGLYIIASGPIPPNPVELLSSQRMREIYEEIKDRFDFILLDTAPIMGLADTLTLTQFVDSVILIVHGGVTPRNEIKETVKRLKGIRAPILGVVINNLNLKKNSYYYYYSYPTPEEAEKKAKRFWSFRLWS